MTDSVRTVYQKTETFDKRREEIKIIGLLSILLFQQRCYDTFTHLLSSWKEPAHQPIFSSALLRFFQLHHSHTMDSIFGLVGDDYAIIAADASASRSILVFKHDEDKIMELDSHKLFAGAGTPADSVHFMEFISASMKL